MRLLQKRTAVSEDGDVEGGRKPVHDGAQTFKRLSRAVYFGAELGEVAGGAQFEQARLLIA